MLRTRTYRSDIVHGETIPDRDVSLSNVFVTETIGKSEKQACEAKNNV